MDFEQNVSFHAAPEGDCGGFGSRYTDAVQFFLSNTLCRFFDWLSLFPPLVFRGFAPLPLSAVQDNIILTFMSQITE